MGILWLINGIEKAELYWEYSIHDSFEEFQRHVGIIEQLKQSENNEQLLEGVSSEVNDIFINEYNIINRYEFLFIFIYFLVKF